MMKVDIDDWPDISQEAVKISDLIKYLIDRFHFLTLAPDYRHPSKTDRGSSKTRIKNGRIWMKYQSTGKWTSGQEFLYKNLSKYLSAKKIEYSRTLWNSIWLGIKRASFIEGLTAEDLEQGITKPYHNFTDLLD